MEASAVPRVAPTGVAAFASPGLLRLLSDDRLVALIREGNANAFEALYDRHHRAILSFCRHMLGGADEAEDAVQHTFIAAYNDLVSSRKPINLRGWLFTIARNRCLSILRARHDRGALELGEHATDGLAAEVQRRQDLRDLVLDINHLPEDQRAALVLAEMGALSHDEIGTVIGVPRGKVKALVFQARESLLASRAARDTDCIEIREQLATMRGGALRRTTLRRHLRECEGCRQYRSQVERQRRRIAAILPVVPTIALRQAVLGAAASGAAAGAGAAGGGLIGTSSLLKGILGKSLIAAMLAALGTTGTILVVHASGPARGASSIGRAAAPLVGHSGALPRPATLASNAGMAAGGGFGAGARLGNTPAATAQLNSIPGSGAPAASGLTWGTGAPVTAPTFTSGLVPGAPLLEDPVVPAPRPPTAPVHDAPASGPGHVSPVSGRGPGTGSVDPGRPSGPSSPGLDSVSTGGSASAISGKPGSGEGAGSGASGGGDSTSGGSDQGGTTGTVFLSVSGNGSSAGGDQGSGAGSSAGGDHGSGTGSSPGTDPGSGSGAGTGAAAGDTPGGSSGPAAAAGDAGSTGPGAGSEPSAP